METLGLMGFEPTIDFSNLVLTTLKFCKQLCLNFIVLMSLFQLMETGTQQSLKCYYWYSKNVIRLRDQLAKKKLS